MLSTPEERKHQSVQEVRREIEDECKYISDPLRRRYSIERKVVYRVSPELLTTEMALRFLKAGEAYWRERAIKSMTDDGGDDTFDYRYWSAYDDALRGADGRESVSKTIMFFRDEASSWRKLASLNEEKIENGGPFEGNPFREISNKQHQVEVWRRCERSMDQMARLFENRLNLKVSRS